MAKFDKKEKQIINLFIQVCGLLTVFLGLSAILGWIFDIPQLASLVSNKIPMPLSTAVLSIVYGLIIFFYNRIISNRIMFRVGIVISSTGILTALLFLYLSLNGIRLGIEHLGLKMSSTVDRLVIGHMSPVTAFCFLLVSLSFLIMLRKSRQKKLQKTSLIFAVLIFFISIIFLLPYLIGTPLLYEGRFIPPALTTSIVLLFLGIALLLISGRKVWSYEELSNVLSTRYTYILAFVFIMLIVSIITVGNSYYKNYEKQFRSEIEQQLSSIAELKVHQIEQWRKERLGDAKVFYKNAEFSILVNKFFNHQNDQKVKIRIKAWIDQVRSGYQYNRVSLNDTSGIEVISSPEEIILKPFNFSFSSSEALKSGQIVFEDFYRDENDNNIYLTIFVPILSEQSDKNVIGVLALRIDPGQYLYPLINKWPTPSKTAETLIVRREGNETVFLNELRFQKNTALNLRRPLTELSLPAAQAALGKKEFMEGVDYRGVPVLSYVCPIPNSPWFLVARVDISEVYAPLQKWLWAIIILVVVLLIGSGASIGLVWWQQRSNFYKERNQSIENIRRLNRVYAVLSEINEAIVRIRKPQELFEQACNIAIEKGGFKMAWIGKINSQTMKVDLVASKGVSEGYLKKIDFNCEGDENLLGIAGRVIKTGVHVISNDIKNDKNILSLHKKSIMYGSKSFAAFPLKVFGQIWGVFKLYSNEIGFFDEEELKLLDELAMNISFSIEFAEKEAERKRADESLQESEERYRQVIQNASDIIFTTDTNGNILFGNNASLSITGYSLEEFTKMNYLKLALPEYKRKVQLFYMRQFKNKLPTSYFEYPVKNKWGDTIWLGQNANLIFENDQIKGFHLLARDITERKKVEEALLANEMKYRELVEASPEAIIIYSEGKIVFANRSTVSLMRATSADELIGKSVIEFVHPEYKEFVVNRMKEMIKTGKTSPLVEEKFLRFDSSVVDVEVIATPIVDDKKTAIQVIVRDITERKRVEKELIKAKEKAEESDRLKMEFLAQMSHEIRTPINIMLGNVDYLNQSFGENMDSEVRDCFEGIDLASKRIIRTVDLILNVAELQTSDYKPQFIKVDLDSEILNKLYQGHKLSAEQKGLEIIYTCKEKYAIVKADEYSITQIFANLIDNAIKYTKKGKVEILLDKNKTGNIVVSVKDTGIGISKEFISKIFEQFTQEEQGYTRTFEGNGLGLSLVKKYCEINNATIEVESDKNAGSTFRVIFKN